MSAISIATADSMSIPPFPVRKFTVSEYRQLGEMGLLSIEDRVELLEGWIVPKMNHNPMHDLALMLCEHQIRNRLSHSFLVRVQMPITTDDSEPEPDIAVVLGPMRRYRSAHPSGTDVKLVVEIADTSLARDRQKCRIYARSGLTEYWIVNLQERQVEMYTNPDMSTSEPRYLNRLEYSDAEFIPLSIADDVSHSISVAELMP